MTHFVILNKVTGERRLVGAADVLPDEGGVIDIGTGAQVVDGAERWPRVHLARDEVLYNGYESTWDASRGEVVPIVKGWWEHVTELGGALTLLTERVAALEARGMGELVVEGGGAVDKAPAGEPVDNREEGTGAGGWEVEGAEAGASVSVSEPVSEAEAKGESRGEEKEGASR